MGDRCLFMANPPSQGGGGNPIGILTSAQEIALLPTTGDAWNNMKARADTSYVIPDLSDQEDDVNTDTLARAFVYTRIGGQNYKDMVIQAIADLPGTEAGARTLAIGREIGAYIVCADLVGLPPSNEATFRAYVTNLLLNQFFSGGGGGYVHITHKIRPNNWGTHACFAMLALARYINDATLWDTHLKVFHGWTGYHNPPYSVSDGYNAFDWDNDVSWQASQANNNPALFCGISPVGSTIQGHNTDGVLPEDQRRQGSFNWPPAQENYAYEAMQGIIAGAIVAHRAGYTPFQWENQAIRRAYIWLRDQANFNATGDDRWQMWAANKYYNTTEFAAGTPASAGKNLAWFDWLYGPGSGPV